MIGGVWRWKLRTHTFTRKNVTAGTGSAQPRFRCSLPKAIQKQLLSAFVKQENVILSGSDRMKPGRNCLYVFTVYTTPSWPLIPNAIPYLGGRSRGLADSLLPKWMPYPHMHARL